MPKRKHPLNFVPQKTFRETVRDRVSLTIHSQTGLRLCHPGSLELKMLAFLLPSASQSVLNEQLQTLSEQSYTYNPSYYKPSNIALS